MDLLTKTQMLKIWNYVALLLKTLISKACWFSDYLE